MKVLWILGEVPIPADSGARLRIVGLLGQLSCRHEITAAVLDPGEERRSHVDELQRMCHDVATLPWRGRSGGAGRLARAAINLLSSLPYSVDSYCDGHAELRLAELAASSFDVIQCENIGFHRYLRAPVSAPRILATHNIEADVWRQRAQLSRHPLLSTYLANQARKMARYEGWLARNYDWLTAVSEEDAARLRSQYSRADVTVVPNGVDTDYYAPSRESPEPGLVLFSGAMDYEPNDDAVRYFLSHIWPDVRCRHPRARFVVVGRRPSASLRSLAERSPAVKVTGWVEDVRPYLAQASVVVVPLRMGGGSRLKILEAMAMAKPVVATTVGAEGLDLHPSRHFLLADDPATFASKTALLLGNPLAGADLGQAAHDYVTCHYGWATSAVPLEQTWIYLQGRRRAAQAPMRPEG